MKPGTRVRIKYGPLARREYVVGNTIGVRPRFANEEEEDKIVRQDVLEVIGEEGVSVEQELYQALEEISLVACGEKQVADDDTEGMKWIYQKAREVLAKYAPGEEKST